jgi:arginine decarboxylase
MTNPEGLVICNGYKDASYIETAMLAQKMGLYTIIVVDRFDELETVLSVSKRFDLRPHIGVRVKLASRGAGKWQESGGEKSKFGLAAGELVQVAERLRDAGMLDCLELLYRQPDHGDPRDQDALKEATRFYASCDLGMGSSSSTSAAVSRSTYGSQTNFHSSANYSPGMRTTSSSWCNRPATRRASPIRT